MARPGASISVRLTVGFAVVLAVFGATLLLTLYYLDGGRKASEQIRVRLEIRREATEIARAAEQLFLRQSEFIESPPEDFSKQTEFHNVYSLIGTMVSSLGALPVDAPERVKMEQLIRRVEELRALFDDEIVPAKIRVDEGSAPPETLSELEARSREAVGALNKLTDELTELFESRTRMAEAHATGAWDISIATAQIIFPVALLTALLVIYYTHRSITGPVSALVNGTKALADGRLNESIDIRGSGEFRELAESFNRMAHDLAANQKRLIEAEKLASVGRLAAGLAHEINNPVAVIIGNAQMLRSSLAEEHDEQDKVQTIIQEARQCKGIIDGLLDLARPADTAIGDVINPSDIIAEVLSVVHALQLTNGIDIEESVIDKDVPLTANRPQVRQLLLNIVRNALEALRARPQGQLKLEGYVRPRERLAPGMLKESSPDATAFLLFVLSDNGPGIHPEHLRALFEPFFTTKADGVGLGLSISYNIARAHGGFIDVQSIVGEGTAFTVGLPLSPSA